MNKETIINNVMQECRLASKLQIGQTVETDKIRIHRFSPSYRVTDLTNAGKRGKTVDQFSVYDIDYYDKYPQISKKFDFLGNEKDYKSALSKSKKAVEEAKKMAIEMGREIGSTIPYAKLEETTYKGVEVKPAGFKKIKIRGKGVDIEADYDSFRIQNTDDKYKLETCIPAIKGKKKSINQFYRWLNDNKNRVKSMTFREINKELDKAGIKTHYFCAMD
jgi:hypothetical protein